MKAAPLAFALLALPADAAEARFVPFPGTPERADAMPANCELTIAFGSYAVGIDERAYEQIHRLLRSDRGVRAVTRHNWGREGELTLCARTRTRADAQRLFHAIRARLPARPRGPITMQLLNGRRYSTPVAPIKP